jgi:hypothetical protein
MIGGSFEITEARAYVDTITLFSRQPLPRQVFREVRGLQKRPLVRRTVPIRGRDGWPIGNLFFNSIRQPANATMDYLARMHGNEITLRAVHVAFDFLVADKRQALEAKHFFCQHLRQTWRRSQDCRSELNSFYWKIGRNQPRNIALYCDRLSKTGGGHCCHLELRFTGADACRRAGLSNLGGLARGVDAFSVLKHGTKLSTVDFGRLDRAVERMARQFLPRTKMHHPVVTVNGARTELTVGLLTVKMRQLLARSLGGVLVEDIRSQDLWDSPRRWLRSALVEIPWEEITPAPNWHCWR